MLTQIYVTIWHHLAKMSKVAKFNHCKLIIILQRLNYFHGNYHTLVSWEKIAAIKQWLKEAEATPAQSTY